jgi:hypothetical protein
MGPKAEKNACPSPRGTEGKLDLSNPCSLPSRVRRARQNDKRLSLMHVAQSEADNRVGRLQSRQRPCGLMRWQWPALARAKGSAAKSVKYGGLEYSGLCVGKLQYEHDGFQDRLIDDGKGRVLWWSLADG